MKKIIGNRGIGKTTQLIEYAAENNCIILSVNAQHLKDKIAYMGYNIEMARNLSSENINFCLANKQNFVIDDLDLAAQRLFGNSFKGFSLSFE